jgi:PAS domain S-box-containing protein
MQSEQRVNILMVDDRPENLMALEAILGDLGQNLVRATSGRDALRHLLNADFAVILLDVQMPGMDGFETAALIRERVKLQHTPIIFLTAMDKNDTSVFRGYSVGAVDYIFKPFAPEVLRAKVSVFIELYRKTEEVKRQSELLRQINRELGKTNKAIGALYKEIETKNVELGSERDFITAILETAGSFVLVFDAEGRVLRFNRACQEITGYTFEEVRGRHIWDFLVAPEQIEWAKELVRTGSYPLDQEGVWFTKNGERRNVAWRNSALRDETGAVQYFIVTGVDITERIRAEEEIRTLNEELEERVTDRTAQLQSINLELKNEIAERERAEEALRESEAKFRRLAESNLIGVHFADMDGNIYDANDAFLDLIGYTREDLVQGNLRWDRLTPQEYSAIDADSIRQLERDRVCTPYEKEYVRSDGARVPVLVGRALLEGSQSISVAFVIDLTERKKSELELKRAKEAAEAANCAKDQFLAVLSHELRTPLTPVLTTVQVLEEEPGLPEDLRVWIEIIRSNVELEARLIDDLLDLTRITQGKLQLNVNTVDVHNVLGSVLDICRPDIQNKNIEVVVELEATQCSVRGDSARLQQVFWNLLKNAVKFTPSGGTITLRTLNETNGMLRVDVHDTGIGIEPEVLPKIFDAFEQGDRNITRLFGGLGLGLAISKTLIDTHGGAIEASSGGKGHGATFSVELPVSMQEPQKLDGNESVPIGVRAGQSVRILIVEDNSDTSQVIQHLLERRGYTVHAVHSIGSALEVTSSQEFDLIISDIGLPDGSGIDLMRKLRQQKPIKGIAVSGYGMEEDIKRSIEAGFAEHLTKPISFRKLTEVIQTLLS